MDFKEFIKPELLVLIPVLYFIGKAVKRSTTHNKLIPYVLGVCGIVLSGLYIFATSELNGWQSWLIAIFATLSQGILVAGGSVYVNELFAQAKKTE